MKVTKQESADAEHLASLYSVDVDAEDVAAPSVEFKRLVRSLRLRSVSEATLSEFTKQVKQRYV